MSKSPMKAKFASGPALEDLIDPRLQTEMFEFLGEGPMRFAPALLIPNVSLKKQLMEGNANQLATYASLKARSELKKKRGAVTDAQLLRIVQFCRFHDAMAYDMMKKCKPHYFFLTASDRQIYVEGHRAVVPLPNLRLSNQLPGVQATSRVVYFRPSRYSPREESKANVIDTLVYILDTWTQHDAVALTHHNFVKSEATYALLVNLKGFSMANFSRQYWSKFMALLQGKIFPVRVDIVLWVDPPPCFDRVWSAMRSMMVDKDFKQNNFRLHRKDLKNFLDKEYLKWLPLDEYDDIINDTDSNRAGTVENLAKDYILFQKYLDTLHGKTGGPIVADTKGRGRGRSIRRRFSMPMQMQRPKSKKIKSIGTVENNDQHSEDNYGDSYGNDDESFDPETRLHRSRSVGALRRRSMGALRRRKKKLVHEAEKTNHHNEHGESSIPISERKKSFRRDIDPAEYRQGRDVLGGIPVVHDKPRRLSVSFRETEEHESERTRIEAELTPKKRRRILKALLKPLKPLRKKGAAGSGKKDVSSSMTEASADQQFFDSSLRLPAASTAPIAPFLTPQNGMQSRRHSSQEFTAATRARLRNQRASISHAGVLYNIPDNYDESTSILDDSAVGWGEIRDGNKSIDWSTVLKDMQELSPNDSCLSPGSPPITPSPGSIPSTILNNRDFRRQFSATSSVLIQPPPFSSPTRRTGIEASPVSTITGVQSTTTDGEDDSTIATTNPDGTTRKTVQDLSYFRDQVERQKERMRKIQEQRRVLAARLDGTLDVDPDGANAGSRVASHEEDAPTAGAHEGLPHTEDDTGVRCKAIEHDAATDTPLTATSELGWSSRTDTAPVLPGPPLTTEGSEEEQAASTGGGL